MPGFVCKEHLETSVNWKSKGCEICDSRESRKVRKRRERREREARNRESE